MTRIRTVRLGKPRAAYLIGCCALAAGGLVAQIALAQQTPALAATNDELHAELQALRAQIREMRSAIGRNRKTTRKLEAMVPVRPQPAPAAAPAFPAGAVPAFVTADKALQFGALTITPGGFIAAESVFRTRTTQSDMNSNFASIPFANSPLGHTNEFRFSARQTRAAVLAEAEITPTMVAAGYLEMDFRAAAVTSNSNEANGYVPQLRHLYGTLDLEDYGAHVLAGQTWSLAVLNSKGITPRNEVTPGVIEGKYVPGFVSPRQPQIRLVKDFGGKLWLGLSLEQPQTTFSTSCPPGANAASAFAISGNFNGNTLNTITCSASGTGGGFASSGNFVGTSGAADALSLNHVPDVVAKAAYELKLGERVIHSEVFGLYRDFTDRVSYTDAAGGAHNTNHDTAGEGVGFGFIAALLPRKLDFQASGLFGRGIGRYGTSQLADTTVNADGSLRPIKEGMLLGGLIAHLTPAIDVYSYAGIEKEFRTFTASGNATTPFYGIGAPTAVADTSAGCGEEPNVLGAYGGAAANPCAGATKQVFQITGGLWDNVYRGAYGQVRVGLQYSFTERQIFNSPGIAPYPAAPSNYQPKAYDNMVFTSLRYYPFN